jgi:hypothetical protein
VEGRRKLKGEKETKRRKRKRRKKRKARGKEQVGGGETENRRKQSEERDPSGSACCSHESCGLYGGRGARGRAVEAERDTATWVLKTVVS